MSKYYDQEEKELIEWFEEEHDNFVSVSGEEKERVRDVFRSDVARRTTKDARITFRVNSHDLSLFKAKAQREGISYQTLLAQIVHKYAQSK